MSKTVESEKEKRNQAAAESLGRILNVSVEEARRLNDENDRKLEAEEADRQRKLQNQPSDDALLQRIANEHFPSVDQIRQRQQEADDQRAKDERESRARDLKRWRRRLLNPDESPSPIYLEKHPKD